MAHAGIMAFDFLKSFLKQKTTHYITEKHGAIIPWYKGVVLRPLDSVILSIPEQVLGKNEQICHVLYGPNDMEINIDSNEHLIHLKLQAGMRVWLTKSCQAIITCDNQTSVRFEIEIPQEYQSKS